MILTLRIVMIGFCSVGVHEVGRWIGYRIWRRNERV